MVVAWGEESEGGALKKGNSASFGRTNVSRAVYDR